MSKITTYKRDQKSDVLTKPKEIPERGAQCKYCKQTGHNVNDANYSREEECPAWNNRCNKCRRLGHFTKACPSGKPKVDSITQSQQDEQLDVQLGLLAVHVNQLVDSRGSTPDRRARCKFCSQTGHGYIPPAKTRRRECPASGKTCNNCQKRGHLARACRSRTSKVRRIQEDKDRPLARRFVKVIPPPIRQVGANYDAQLPDRTSDEDSDDDDDYYRQELQMEEPLTPQPPLHPLHDGAGSPPPPAVGNTRPHRNTRPPDRYTDAGYDVSTLMLTDQNFPPLL